MHKTNITFERMSPPFLVNSTKFVSQGGIEAAICRSYHRTTWNIVVRWYECACVTNIIDQRTMIRIFDHQYIDIVVNSVESKGQEKTKGKMGRDDGRVRE